MASQTVNFNISEPIVKKKEVFDLSGPAHLKTVNWTNPCHQRSVAASLVRSVYILERDRKKKRERRQALAPSWWKAFNFQLHESLIDDADSSVFGAIYHFSSTSSDDKHSTQAPRCCVAFRGTIKKGCTFMRDLELDIHIIRNTLHQTSRFEKALQAVRHAVATFGSTNINIWLAGHSLGAALATLAGKNMANTGAFIDAFLFNPPFFSAPIETINNKTVKHGLRTAVSVFKAGVAIAMENNHQMNCSEDEFVALSPWLPRLYVNPSDYICKEYIGYFEHRKRMEDIGAGGIERRATRESVRGVLKKALGKQSEEPLRLIPSAKLIVNLTPAQDFDAHGIYQWWRPDLHLESKTYNYK